MHACKLNRGLALTLPVALVAMQLQPLAARADGGPGASSGVAAAPRPFEVAAGDHFLRDAVPIVAHAAEPPDTTDDEFFLPEEQDKKKLIRDITAFVIASAFVAYFIIKVFIEKDKEETPPKTGGKGIPLPR